MKLIARLRRIVVLAAAVLFIATANIHADPQDVTLAFYSGRGIEIIKGDSTRHDIPWKEDGIIESIQYISLSPDGEQILCSLKGGLGGGGRVVIHDFHLNKTKEIRFAPMVAGCPIWSRDGNSFYYATLEGNILEGPCGIYEYDLRTRRERPVIEYPKAISIQSIALSPDGRFIYYGLNFEAIYRVDLLRENPKPELVVPIDFLDGLAVGKDFLVFCDKSYPDGGLYYFDLTTKEIRPVFDTPMHESDIVLDGKYVYCLSRIGFYSIIWRINLENGERVVIVDSEKDGTDIIHELTGIAPLSLGVRPQKPLSITTWGKLKSGSRSSSSCP